MVQKKVSPPGRNKEQLEIHRQAQAQDSKAAGIAILVSSWAIKPPEAVGTQS